MASREVKVQLRADVEDLVVKLNAAKVVLGIRERELLELKGPCNGGCRLHKAHFGPCDIRKEPSDG